MTEHDPTRRTVLKTTAGLAVAATGLTAATGSAAAHFPRKLAVDVKPESINPRSNGVTTVFVLQNDDFDPTDKMPERYRFGAPDVVGDGGGATPVDHSVEDVSGDGRDDLVLKFETRAAGFEHGDEEAELRWDRDQHGHHGLSGRDEIRTVGGGRGR